MKGFKLVALLAVSIGLMLVDCSSTDDNPNPISPTVTNSSGSLTKRKNDPQIPLITATAQVTIRGSWLMSYTVQIIQNSTVRAQNTNVTLPLGYRTISFSGLPTGCGYIAKVWANGIGVQSNTWPSKCLSGTTHLGCLQFDMAGDPEPWSGSCP